MFARGDTPTIANTFSELMTTIQSILLAGNKQERVWGAKLWHSEMWFGERCYLGSALTSSRVSGECKMKWIYRLRQITHYWNVGLFKDSRPAGVNHPFKPSANFCVELRHIAQSHTHNHFALKLPKVLQERFDKTRYRHHDKARTTPDPYSSPSQPPSVHRKIHHHR